jgi:membrane protein
VQRDIRFGGGIMAGALAFRFFLVALPLALVLVSGLGFLSKHSTGSVSDTAANLRFTAAFTDSVSHAAVVAQKGRWYTLSLGVVLLLWGAFSTTRTIRTIHRIAWGEGDPHQPHPTSASLLFIAGVFLFLAASALVAWLRAAGGPAIGAVSTLILFAFLFLIWMGASMVLPHRTATWRELAPGCLVFALGYEALQVFTVYFIAWRLTRASALYGSLGTAFAMLGWLYLLGRIMVAAPIVNSGLWERKHGAGGPGAPDEEPLADLAQEAAP